jgi:hypothetical protein
MRILGLTVAFLAILAAAPLWMASAEDGFRVDYIGGTIASLGVKAEGSLRTNGEQCLEFRAKKTGLQVQYAKINLLEYGQKVDRRYAMAFLLSPLFILSKSRQHFLTVGYMDEAGQQQAMVFKVAKGSVRSILVSLEARTGLTVQYQDGEARKAGKG